MVKKQNTTQAVLEVDTERVPSWKTSFDTMALKTVLKKLISKYGIMSIEMTEAMTYDLSADAEVVEVMRPSRPGKLTAVSYRCQIRAKTYPGAQVIKFKPLASGSKGNCYHLTDGTTEDIA